MLQGKKLASVVSEVLDDQRKQDEEMVRVKVKSLVGRLTAEIKHEEHHLKQHKDCVTATHERIEALQDRLNALKRGEASALDEPKPDKVEAPWRRGYVLDEIGRYIPIGEYMLTHPAHVTARRIQENEYWLGRGHAAFRPFDRAAAARYFDLYGTTPPWTQINHQWKA